MEPVRYIIYIFFLIIYRILSVSKSLTLDFFCNYELQKYPFDNQLCLIQIESFGSDAHLIELIQSHIHFKGSKQVFQYQVEDPVFLKTNGSSIIIQIRFKRELYYITLATLLPSILINVVRCILNFLNISSYVRILYNLLFI